MDTALYRIFKRMADVAKIAIPAQSTPLDDPAWVAFATKLEGHVS